MKVEKEKHHFTQKTALIDALCHKKPNCLSTVEFKTRILSSTARLCSDPYDRHKFNLDSSIKTNRCILQSCTCLPLATPSRHKVA